MAHQLFHIVIVFRLTNISQYLYCKRLFNFCYIHYIVRILTTSVTEWRSMIFRMMCLKDLASQRAHILLIASFLGAMNNTKLDTPFLCFPITYRITIIVVQCRCIYIFIINIGVDWIYSRGRTTGWSALWLVRMS